MHRNPLQHRWTDQQEGTRRIDVNCSRFMLTVSADDVHAARCNTGMENSNKGVQQANPKRSFDLRLQTLPQHLSVAAVHVAMAS